MWTTKGIPAGVLTRRRLQELSRSPGATPGRPVNRPSAPGGDPAAVCPTGALSWQGEEVHVALGRCISCQRCRREADIPWQPDALWAESLPGLEPTPRSFRHSLHVRVLDGGDGGETLRELRQLTSPYYALHRLGIFFTPTPRDADVLLVVGPVTQGTRQALLDTYEAMPDPKRVMAVGSAAISGVPTGPSFTASGGVSDLLPVDVAVPGNPPPPLAILDGLLILMGRSAAKELMP